MARTIKGREFFEEWVLVKAGETYRDCRFIDCIVQNVPGPGVREMYDNVFDGCTFIGVWPAEFRMWKPCEAVRADEPEVIEARVSKSIRPASRQRRSIFNWRKRD